MGRSHHSYPSGRRAEGADQVAGKMEIGVDMPVARSYIISSAWGGNEPIQRRQRGRRGNPAHDTRPPRLKWCALCVLACLLTGGATVTQPARRRTCPHDAAGPVSAQQLCIRCQCPAGRPAVTRRRVHTARADHRRRGLLLPWALFCPTNLERESIDC